MDRVIVDTTVMPKAIAHLTDIRLMEKRRQHLVKAAKEYGLRLRQNYNRIAPRLTTHIRRYAHSKLIARAGSSQGEGPARSHRRHPDATHEGQEQALRLAHTGVECISKRQGSNVLRVRFGGEHCDDLEGGGWSSERAACRAIRMTVTHWSRRLTQQVSRLLEALRPETRQAQCIAGTACQR